MISWNVLEDRSRSISGKKGFKDIEEFLKQETDLFLQGYDRCLIQSQPRHIEVWFEKDALSSIFKETVYPYCIRCITCKGYLSISFITDFYTRATEALNRGQTPTVLYFGDFDPSGIDMFEATQKTLTEDLGLVKVQYIRAALNPDQCANLAVKPLKAKKTDKRYKKFYERFKTKETYELDALHPSELSALIKNTIEKYLDIEGLELEKKQERVDKRRIASLDVNCVECISAKLESLLNFSL